MGHIWLRRHALDNGFAGVCPYHRDCLEGLASGPAVTARLGAPLSQAPAGAPIWTILSEYLAQACLNIALIATPDRIVMGGGVLSNRALFPLIRQAVLRLNNGYMSWLDCADRVDAFIVPPALGDQAGLAGALLMAQATRLRPSA
jgi:fructokinase